MTTPYRSFLESKIVVAARAGFDINVDDLHPDTKPHQRDTIRWAASLGRALLALKFGLGKTRIQCELAKAIHGRTGKRFLVICPLGAKHQFTHEDGPVLGMHWQYVTTDDARADEPVTKDKNEYTRGRWQVDAHAYWRSSGNSPLLPGELYNYEEHVGRLEELDRLGHLPASFFYEPPRSLSEHVWDDIVYMRTLNTEQSKGRLENHICPLPFDIVERVIRLYSNEGDLVLDPFMGLGTVPMIAMKLGRIGHGIELNHEYYQAALKYLKQVQQEKMMPTLFDLLEVKTAEAR